MTLESPPGRWCSFQMYHCLCKYMAIMSPRSRVTYVFPALNRKLIPSMGTCAIAAYASAYASAADHKLSTDESKLGRIIE